MKLQAFDVPPAEQPHFLTVPRPPHRTRRLVSLAAVALVLGISAHGVCQAVEHHYGAQDAAALCAAAVALVASVGLVGAGRHRPSQQPLRWIALTTPAPVGAGSASLRRPSAAWLQRFQN